MSIVQYKTLTHIENTFLTVYLNTVCGKYYLSNKVDSGHNRYYNLKSQFYLYELHFIFMTHLFYISNCQCICKPMAVELCLIEELSFFDQDMMLFLVLVEYQ